jgi:Rrf2 family cysteine metabolism transcriptional repressor
MRISTRGRYALRAMVDLTLHADAVPVSRHGIAARQGISADYVAQLFRRLSAAGLVEGVKGPGGGYRLAREPAAISAGDVVRAVEGPIAATECIIPSDEATCDRVDRCVTHLLWKGLSEAMGEFLDSTTLKDLCDQARQLTQQENKDNGANLP